MGRRERIDRVIEKYGADVTLKYLPVENFAEQRYVEGIEQEDWPDPFDEPTVDAPDDAVVKAIVVPNPDVEYTGVSDEGVSPGEMVQGFFLATQDLNAVKRVVWQGNEYRILQQDAYELQGEILAQQVLMLRTAAEVLMPHGT